jgi:hypothetical protein
MRSFDHAFLRRAAFLGLLAVASATLLPYVHALGGGCDHSRPACDGSDRGRDGARSDAGDTTSHSRHCGVCGALAQTKSRTLVSARSLPLVAHLLGFTSTPLVSVIFVSSADSDVADARAPPASLRSA